MGFVQLFSQSLFSLFRCLVLLHECIEITVKLKPIRKSDVGDDGKFKNDKKGPHRNAAPSLGISLARLEFAN